MARLVVSGATPLFVFDFSQAGAQLVVLNLSQQTDSSDLLGGFRPVEPRDAVAPLLPPFADLMSRTWTRSGPIPGYFSSICCMACPIRANFMLGMDVLCVL